jgi:hypothetical protein
MSWVVSGERRYYYRSRRQPGGTCRREYVGGGLEAELAAALDTHRRQQRQAQREALRAEREAWERGASMLEELIAHSNLLVQACLLVAGFHQHQRGEWRRRAG